MFGEGGICCAQVDGYCNCIVRGRIGRRVPRVVIVTIGCEGIATVSGGRRCGCNVAEGGVRVRVLDGLAVACGVAVLRSAASSNSRLAIDSRALEPLAVHPAVAGPSRRDTCVRSEP